MSKDEALMKQEKRKVTFIIWSMADDDATNRSFIEVSETISTKQPIKLTAIKIIKSLETPNITINYDINDDSLLIIKPLPNDIDIQQFVNDDSHGCFVKYALDQEGRLHILDNMESLRQNWTLEDFDQLSTLNYIDYKRDYIVVVIPSGLGASGPDFDQLILMVNTIVNFITIGQAVYITSKNASKAFRRVFIDRQARKIAKQWANCGIKYPEQLREFIDVKAEWSLSEVKIRLGINEEYAVGLLYALGLEPINNSWRLSQSKGSIARRQQWVVNESKQKS